MEKPLSYYDEEDDVGTVRTTVSIPGELHRELVFICDLFNEFDRQHGRKGKKRWKPSRLLVHFGKLGARGIAIQIGGIPRTKEEHRTKLAEARQLYDKLR